MLMTVGTAVVFTGIIVNSLQTNTVCVGAVSHEIGSVSTLGEKSWKVFIMYFS